MVYHARIAEEAGALPFLDVAAAIGDKMVRRHPHVFGAARIATAKDQNSSLGGSQGPRAGEQGTRRAIGLTDDVPISLPALTRALKLSARAAMVGFV